MSNATSQTLGKSLPKGHKVLLLSVPDNDKIETAQEIVDMSWKDARKWIKRKYPFAKIEDVWDWL